MFEMKTTPRERAADRSAEAGFSLLELLIAMFVLTEVMAAILLLFTGLTDIARAQTNIAEVQQTQRVTHRSVARAIREAGRGGLPATVLGPQNPVTPGVFPDGLAVAMRNNVPANAKIQPTLLAASDDVLEGSDVLIARGVFSTPIYYISPQIGTVDLDNPGVSLLTGGAEPFSLQNRLLTIPGRFLDAIQDFQPLIDAIALRSPRLLVVRDVLNPQSYGVIEVTAVDTPPACVGCPITLSVNFTDAGDVSAYAELVPPRDGSHALTVTGAQTVPFPKRIGAVGLLEEYRFYIRPDASRPILLADRANTIPTPMLSRIEVIPNTDIQVGNRLDIAENVFDLQIAVGIDTSPVCDTATCSAAVLLERGRITEDRTVTEEVFFNHPDDDDPTNLPDFSTGLPDFHFLRLTTVVLADRVERGHSGSILAQVEDRVRSTDTVSFGGGSFSYANSLPGYRRRLLSTVIDLRNL